jgi:hypothetical protein
VTALQIVETTSRRESIRMSRAYSGGMRRAMRK